jgi:putative PEP-CTERM system TPR-repeat lipoprotein
MLRKRVASVSLILTIAAVALGCGRSAEAKKRQYVQMGDRYVAEKKLPEAIFAYANAVKQDERDGDARHRLGKAYLAANDPRNALEQLVRAADLLPNDASVQLDAANILVWARRYEDARARTDLALKADPKNIQAHLTRAVTNAGLRDYDAAVADIRHAVDIDPRRSSTYYELGGIQLMQGKSAEAEATFKQAVALNPKSVDAHLALASLYWNTKRPADAEQSITKALEIDPRNVAANRTLANWYLGSNRPQDAEAPLKRAADAAGDVAGRMELAEYYVRQKRINDARTVLEALARTPEGFAPATIRLAELEYDARRKEQANGLVDSVLAKQPTNPRALVVKGGWLLSEQKLDDALARAEAAVKADPQFADAHFLLGSVRAQRHEREKAIESFREVLRLNPKDGRADKAMSALSLQGGQREDSLKFAEEAAKARPGDAAARLLLIRTLLANGDVARAHTELQKIMPALVNVAEAHVLMGHIQLAEKNAAGARQSYERAMELDPKSIQALGGLVQLDAAAKQLDQAQRRVDDALARSPDNPQVLLLAARTYATKADNARAESLLKKAIEVDPSYMQAYGLLGQLYFRQGKLDQARTQFQQLADKRPNDASAGTMVGMLLEAQGKKDDAKKAYESIYERNPKAAIAANNLAVLLAQEGTNLDRALNLAQAAKAQMPDDPNISDTLGWVYYKKNLASLAIEPLEFSVRKDPSRAVYQYHLGLAYMKAGDKAKGKMWLDRALKLQPDSDLAAEARKVLSS